MQAEQLKQSIHRIEECADDAKRAVQQQASIPSDLRDCVNQLHDQAKQAQQQVDSGQQQQGQSQDGLRQALMQMEQTGDRAMQACRQAGNSVDPQTQQSVKRLHDEVSSLKKQIQMG